MICRIWRGWTTRENAANYEKVVREQVIPAIESRKIHGFIEIELMRRDLATAVEFQTLMWFETLDAVKSFVGADFEACHVPPAAEAYLDDFERRVVHFEVIERRSQRE